MTKKEVISLILEHGSISQRYIIKRDILGETVNSHEMRALQGEIVTSKPVQKLLKCQNSKGWFGYELHGGPGTAMDCTVGTLIDLGVEPSHDFMRKAKEALIKDLNPDPMLGRHFFSNVRGYDFSRCTTLGDLQLNNEPLSDELASGLKQILCIFNEVLNIKSLDEVSKPCTRKKYIGHRAYLKNKFFPWISDILTLSNCLAWKNAETIELMNKSLNHISTFMPIPIIFDVAPDGHYIAPIGCYNDFSYDDPADIPKGAIVFWLRDYPRLCRVCNIEKVPYFFRQVIKFAEYVVNDTLFDKLTDIQLTAIQKTFGNSKWKNDIHKRVDVYFKCLQLLHEAKIEF